MNRPTRLWFVERARAWLFNERGPFAEERLADELEKMWELGVANSIEALDEVRSVDSQGEDALLRREVEETLRALVQRPKERP